MKITLVKKILADGSECKKCADVMKRLEENDQLKHIDTIIIADEQDASSPGMQLAAELKVNRAPFFVVERQDQEPVVYTVYYKFVKEVLEQSTSTTEEIQEIMNDNPDLDYI